MKKIIPFLLAVLLLASCAPPPSPDGSPSPSGTGASPSAKGAAPSPLPSPLPSHDEPSPEEPSPVLPSPSPIETEAYTGVLYHVFYHFLNAFPELAFTTGYGKDLDAVCVGPQEFWRSLEELYKNGFVLVNVNDYNEIGADGKLTAKPILVPIGKKPLVLSFDDINYYAKNLGKGICDKVILDAEGKLAMQTTQADGSALVTYDNDVIPLLEAFCEQHPDFSPFGVKGLLSITGYDGILGYRTQKGSPGREREIEAVAPVVQALLDAGWYFGSHSYSHFHMNSVGADRVAEDTDKWLDEVGPLVGETRIYLFPYGEWPEHSGPKFKHLLDKGFSILCGVGMPPYYKLYERYAFMDRQFVDGTSLRNHKKWLEPLMDPVIVYCPEERNHVPLTAPALAGVVDGKGVPVYHEGVVTVAIGGDVSLYGILGDQLRQGGPGAIIDDALAALFREADLSIINLESAVTDIGEPWPGKDYALRAAPDILPFLTDTLGVGAVSLANNHSIDYGEEAFFDTLDRLSEAGIGYAGGGRDLAEASRPAVFEMNGTTVAFLAACQHAPYMEWYAKENRPGLLMCYDTTLLAQAVREAKALYDYVIVYIHWGVEYERLPTDLQVGTARRVIDAGADAVIGAHPHVIQSFEVYKGKPIAYSLGNFLMRNPNDNTAVAVLRLSGGQVEMEIVPCHVEARSFVSPAGKAQRETLFRYWQELSENAEITMDGMLR